MILFNDCSSNLISYCLKTIFVLGFQYCDEALLYHVSNSKHITLVQNLLHVNVKNVGVLHWRVYF